MSISTPDAGVAGASSQKGNRPAPRRAGALELPVLLAASTASLVWGWQNRNSGDLTAETGAGYILGIVGGSMMLILLIYPLRKRVPGLRTIGGVRGWFRIHMMLGIIGPVLVVLHSNFNLGSLNGTIALSTMLIVAGSGLIGRFFYGRIHHGLYGRRAQLREYTESADGSKWGVGQGAVVAPGLLQVLEDYEARRLGANHRLFPSLVRVLAGPFVHVSMRRKALKVAWAGSKPSRENKRRLRGQLQAYQLAVARVEAFLLYERLFALWHLLHLPLFVIMVLAAIGHVLAVHMY